MANNTYTKILTASISQSGLNIAANNIPTGYQDILIHVSGRTDVASTGGTIGVWFNNDGTSINSFTQVYGTGSSAASGRGSNTFPSAGGVINGASSTAGIYTSIMIYVPNYANTSNFKSAQFTSVMENNTTAANIYQTAILYRSTNAINSVSFNGQQNTQGFLAGTTLTLYGIKNS